MNKSNLIYRLPSEDLIKTGNDIKLIRKMYLIMSMCRPQIRLLWAVQKKKTELDSKSKPLRREIIIS